MTEQLSVFLENKPGVLAKFCATLSAEKINIRGISVTDSVDHAVVRMVVDEPTKALHLLGERHTLALETEVLAVELEDRPGALAGVAKKLADAEINIEYAYGSSSENKSLLFMRVSDIQKAKKVLGL